MHAPIARSVNEAAEPSRAITSAMSELAAIIGDVDTEIRRLAKRIGAAIPGGSPFDQPTKGSEPPPTSGAPMPCQSEITEQLQTRIAQLRGMAHSLNGMTDRIEL